MLYEEPFLVEFKFFFILLGIFAAGAVLVVAHALYKQWKRCRLTSAHKDYYR